MSAWHLCIDPEHCQVANSWVQETRQEAATAFQKINELIEEPTVYRVTVLHPIETDHFGDGVTFTAEQLQKYGETLSGKQIIIDHDGLRGHFESSPYRKTLPHPQNRVLEISYNPATNALEGTIQISDGQTKQYIEGGIFKRLSVEHKTNWDGSLEFTRLSLLSPGITPRDPKTEIRSENGIEQLARLASERVNLSTKKLLEWGPDNCAKLALGLLVKDTPQYQDRGIKLIAEALNGIARRVAKQVVAQQPKLEEKMQVVNEVCDDPTCLCNMVEGGV